MPKSKTALDCFTLLLARYLADVSSFIRSEAIRDMEQTKTVWDAAPWDNPLKVSLTHWGLDQIDAIFSLKFIPKGPITEIPALVQIAAWRRLGDNPLSEPMMIILLTYICVTASLGLNELDPNPAKSFLT